MANEVTVINSLAYSDANGTQDALATPAAGFSYSPATLRSVKVVQTILTTETVINLGGISTPGWITLQNLDPTNYVDVKVAASGAIFARLLPAGGPLQLYLGTGAQVPVAIANTASCLVSTMITPA